MVLSFSKVVYCNLMKAEHVPNYYWPKTIWMFILRKPSFKAFESKTFITILIENFRWLEDTEHFDFNSVVGQSENPLY